MTSRAYPNVFSPLTVGPVTIKNRIEAGPAIPLLASPGGMVTDALISFMEQLARSGAGIVTVGDSAVDDSFAMGHLNQLNLGNHRVIPGLAKLVQAIERHGAVASIEINHSGRFVPPLLLSGGQPWGPSPVRSRAEQQFQGQKGREAVDVHEMTPAEIRQVVDEFATAAEHCRMAGFRMITLHGGHGHLIMQFLSPLSNQRTDEYGGSFENRCRFAEEVIRAVRARIGRDMAIEYRLSAEEQVAGGLHFGEVTEFVRRIENQIDMVQVSYGSICEPSTAPIQMQPIYVPRGPLVTYAEQLKRRVSIPVCALGGITMEMAEDILAAGKADTVAIVRGLLADRRLVEKYRARDGENACPCVRCGLCMEQTSNFLPVICAVNPLIGRESEFTEIFPALHPKRVTVVGGGPAGMQAALTAAERGHQVVLYEARNHLGGNLVIASAQSYKEDMQRYCNWLVHQVMQDASIELKMSSRVTAAEVAAGKPDAVFVAIGAAPYIPVFEGQENAVWVGDIAQGSVMPGHNVLIIGAGLTGLDEALELARQGRIVTVADVIPADSFGKGCNGVAKIALLSELRRLNVRFIGDALLRCVTKEGATLAISYDDEQFLPADTVIISTGFRARAQEAGSFLDTASNVVCIGDCVRPANIHKAVHAGFNAAYDL